MILRSSINLNRRRALTFGLGTAWLLSHPALALDYPTRPLKMMTFFPPGGIADGIARLAAERIGSFLGQPVVVDSRPGAASFISARATLRAPSDGYTLQFVGATSILAELLYPNPGFSYFADFLPVAGLGAAVQLLVVRADLPIHTVQELIDYAKAKPGELNYASIGSGSSTHVQMELFKSLTGTQLTHIPYRGSGPATLAMLAGDVDVMFDGPGSSMPHVQAGKFRALGVSTAQFSPVAPDVPPLAMSGVPEFDVKIWTGLMVRSGTRNAIAERINEAVNNALAEPEVQRIMHQQGFETMPGSRAQFGQFIARDRKQWENVIRSAKIKADV